MRRTFGKSTSQERAKAKMLALLKDGNVVDKLATVLSEAAMRLTQQRAATSYGLHSKFEQEASAFTMDFKGLSTFYSGLEGVIGPPQPNLFEGMRREHCKAADSHVEFRVSNYGTCTKSVIEWCADSESRRDSMPRHEDRQEAGRQDRCRLQ